MRKEMTFAFIEFCCRRERISFCLIRK